MFFILAVLLPVAGDARDLAIRNATIVTVTQGTIENGTIVVRNGRIAEVGPSETVRIPAGINVIEGRGFWVSPGIVDTHSHSAVEGAVNELTLPNTGMVRIADVLDPDDISVYRQLAGGTTTAQILHGSANAIGGQSAVVKWKWGRPASEWLIADAPQGIKFALGENPKSGNTPPRPGVVRQYPDTRMGVAEVVEGAFIAARDYERRWEQYREDERRKRNPIPPRRDLLMETMSGILSGDILVHSHCYRADEIMMLLNVAKRMGFRIQTLQHVLEGYKVAPEIAMHGTGASTFIDWWGFKMEAYDGIPYNPALMHRSGVLASINSDSSELARHLNVDAAKAIHWGGLSEDEALALATINPARQLKLEHRVGSIERGKDADLVIWTDHPLSTYARVETTLIEGEVYFDRARDMRQREQRRLERIELERIARERAEPEKDPATEEEGDDR